MYFLPILYFGNVIFSEPPRQRLTDKDRAAGLRRGAHKPFSR